MDIDIDLIENNLFNVKGKCRKCGFNWIRKNVKSADIPMLLTPNEK